MTPSQGRHSEATPSALRGDIRGDTFRGDIRGDTFRGDIPGDISRATLSGRHLPVSTSGRHRRGDIPGDAVGDIRARPWATLGPALPRRMLQKVLSAANPEEPCAFVEATLALDEALGLVFWDVMGGSVLQSG